MWNRPLILSLLAALVVAGCTGTKDTTAKQPDPGESSPTPAASDASAVSLQALPDELKHAAYEYYGLGSEEPRDVEVREGSAQPITGGQRFRLKDIQDGKAIFEYEHSGGLAMQGTFTISLEKDGIYSIGSSVAEVSPHELEMPADVAVGKTWVTNTKFMPNGGGPGLEQKATNRAVRIEKVTTKAGEFPEALLVESKGPATIGGEPFEMSTRMWFVKGRGIVKMVNTRTPKGGQPVTVTIEATS